MLVPIGIIDEWGVLEMFASFRFNKSSTKKIKGNKRRLDSRIEVQILMKYPTSWIGFQMWISMY